MSGKKNDSSLKKVVFLPEKKEVWVLKGTSILEAALKAGIPINSPCGGKGICGKCRVKISPLPSPSPSEVKILGKDINEGWRLACQHYISQDSFIEIPSSSRFYEQVILKELKLKKVKLNPGVKKFKVSLPERLEGTSSLTERLPFPFSSSNYPFLKTFAKRAEKSKDFSIVFHADGRLSFMNSKHFLGLALDIGTTTVVGYLVDLETAKILSVSAITNPQIIYGQDVVSRLQYALEKDKGTEILQKEIIEGVNSLIKTLLKETKAKKNDIWEVTVCGNTVMMHLFLGLKPYLLSKAPFVSLWRGALNVSPTKFGLDINKEGNVYILPVIASFVGSDTSAVIISTGIHLASGVKMAVDIGTNGEIILCKNGEITVTSTAAGPAFEGARISQGMRAEKGAIDKVKIDETGIHIGVIGNVSPKGICGTGLVDAVAELLKIGVIAHNGYLKKSDQLQNFITPLVKERLKNSVFYLTPEVKITQRDIRELQVAKAAIRAGMKVLLRSKGLKEEDVDELYIAGGFGSYLSKESAVKIGLIPPLEGDKIKVVGNAAGAGSYLVLINKKLREKLEKIIDRVEFLELAHRKEFQEEFAEQMLFPEWKD